MDEDQAAWFDKAKAERDRMVDDVRAEAEDPTWTWGADLRSHWGRAQRADKDRHYAFAKHPTLPHDLRWNPQDGVLEKLVSGKWDVW